VIARVVLEAPVSSPRHRSPGGAPSGRDAHGSSAGARDGGRLRALDGLRLLCALFVAAYHYLGINVADRVWGEPASGIFPSAEVIAPYGWLGVEIFFVISGFVICMSAWGKTVGEFTRSRITRLFPAYWVAVLLTFTVITFWPVLDERPTVADAIANLTMLQSPLGAMRVDGVYWTLWTEMRFYLVFGLLVFMGLTYKRVVVFCAAWLMLGAISHTSGAELLKVFAIPDYGSYFVVGIGLYLIHRFGHRLVSWLLVGAGAAISLYRVEARVVRMDERWTDAPVHYWVAALILLTSMAVILAIGLGWLRWMSWGWLTVAGALTYPFYLLHQMIGYSVIHELYTGLGLSAYVVLPATLLAMLLLSWLVYRLVERPLSRWLRQQLAQAARSWRTEDEENTLHVRRWPLPALAGIRRPSAAQVEERLIPVPARQAESYSATRG
jgi:peptidoglycan/LPS O-acetylase OafA/YrhL